MKRGRGRSRSRSRAGSVMAHAAPVPTTRTDRPGGDAADGLAQAARPLIIPLCGAEAAAATALGEERGLGGGGIGARPSAAVDVGRGLAAAGAGGHCGEPRLRTCVSGHRPGSWARGVGEGARRPSPRFRRNERQRRRKQRKYKKNHSRPSTSIPTSLSPSSEHVPRPPHHARTTTKQSNTKRHTKAK